MEIGKIFLIIGLIFIIIGLLYIFLQNIGFPPKLPGDILIKRGNFTFYFPIVTSIIISIILTILAQIFFKR